METSTRYWLVLNVIPWVYCTINQSWHSHSNSVAVKQFLSCRTSIIHLTTMIDWLGDRCFTIRWQKIGQLEPVCQGRWLKIANGKRDTHYSYRFRKCTLKCSDLQKVCSNRSMRNNAYMTITRLSRTGFHKERKLACNILFINCSQLC